MVARVRRAEPEPQPRRPGARVAANRRWAAKAVAPNGELRPLVVADRLGLPSESVDSILKNPNKKYRREHSRQKRSANGDLKEGVSDRTLRDTRQDIRACFMQALENIGYDGFGLHGVTGYFMQLAEKDMRAAAAVICKLLPSKVEAEVNGSTRTIPAAASQEEFFARLIGIASRTDPEGTAGTIQAFGAFISTGRSAGGVEAGASEADRSNKMASSAGKHIAVAVGLLGKAEAITPSGAVVQLDGPSGPGVRKDKDGG